MDDVNHFQSNTHHGSWLHIYTPYMPLSLCICVYYQEKKKEKDISLTVLIKTKIIMDWNSLQVIFPLLKTPTKYVFSLLTKYAIEGRDIYFL